ncbi:helix-turn-helix domain-containing protein [Nocardia sp. IBHARD005]|uniref:helix-turn-helix domain-containing protein n=1 Tax=Nocardia sp. IBHARD005 TaxID=3457765 RepID=UPI004057E7FB
MESGPPPAVVGAQLRAAREAAGFSLTELADRVAYSRAALGHYETGRRVPTADVVKAYRGACGPLDAVTTAEALGRADLDRRGFLRSAAYSASLAATALLPMPEHARLAAIGDGTGTGAADVAAVRGVTDALLRFDEVRGGGAGRTAMTAFLSTDVSALLRSRFTDAQVRAEAFSAAAELAYAIGFSSHDVGADGAALRYFLAALRLAEESGVPGQDGFVLRIIALHAGDVGMPQHSIELAERAVSRARGHVDVDAMAVFDVALARTYAEGGDHRAARETLRRIEPWLTPTTTTELPRWLSLFCPNKASIGRQASKAFAALGDLSEAERHLHMSVVAWNPETHTRIRALSEIETGLLRWKLGRHEDAARLWRTALPVVAGVDSDRTRKAVAKVTAVAPEVAVTT